MPRTIRLIIPAMLAVGLLAAGCGEDEAAEESDDASTEAVSEVTASGDDRPAATTSESTEQADTAAEPEPEPAPEPARLADRFPWCSTHQRTWDRLAEMQLRADDMEAAMLDAQAALDAATDELDIAEAAQALESAEESHAELVPTYREVLSDATWLLSPDWRGNRGGETELIAVERARDAFNAAADPTLLELLEAVRAGIPRSEPPPAVSEPEEDAPLSPEELRADLEALRDEADDAALASIGAKQAMESAFLDLQAAQTPEDGLDAYQRFLADYRHLRKLADDAQVIRWTAEYEVYDALWATGGATDASRQWVEDIRNADRYTSSIHPWPYAPNRVTALAWSEVEWAVRLTSEQAVNEFVLDDPAWRAFQASLSESCQP